MSVRVIRQRHRHIVSVVGQQNKLTSSPVASHRIVQNGWRRCEVMTPFKFVVKCGNFAVLVDLHVLPLGSPESTSWFSTDQVKEVASLVRDPVDQRVKQYAEFLHNRRRPKQKKELPPASAFYVKGENFNLVANFLRRHSKLRCVVEQDLRLFPERYVVCVSCPEDALVHHGNLSLAVLLPHGGACHDRTG
ncbi:hypothetical protein ILYODFUR_000552 [Ilyodon furcidens]|uniref:Protein SLX4IP n=1 Tax=Ilyodon furcidens TaxID=33524 RepID=A0ABV0SK81_9TELE